MSDGDELQPERVAHIRIGAEEFRRMGHQLVDDVF